jgi:hypothetical protein
MRYELFYSYGGRGGPYPSLQKAWTKAISLLDQKNKPLFIDIRLYSKSGCIGGYADFMRVSLHNGVQRWDPKSDQWFMALYEVHVNDRSVTNSYILKESAKSFEDIIFAFTTANLTDMVSIKLTKTIAPGEVIKLLEGTVERGAYYATKPEFVRYDDELGCYVELPVVFESIVASIDGFIPKGWEPDVRAEKQD